MFYWHGLLFAPQNYKHNNNNQGEEKLALVLSIQRVERRVRMGEWKAESERPVSKIESITQEKPSNELVKKNHQKI